MAFFECVANNGTATISRSHATYSQSGEVKNAEIGKIYISFLWRGSGSISLISGAIQLDRKDVNSSNPQCIIVYQATSTTIKFNSNVTLANYELTNCDFVST
jgi:hypothetical protein